MAPLTATSSSALSEFDCEFRDAEGVGEEEAGGEGETLRFSFSLYF
jgi:hypothetical protein